MQNMEPPDTASLLTEGPGLGLAIAASLARRMGGVIQHVGDGALTTITLAMPLAPADAWTAFPTGDRRTTKGDPTVGEFSNRFTIDTANASDAPTPAPAPQRRIRFN
jgi:hypothetical protein